ncbi:MAG: DMT family transporter [Oscillospiraceae bacterium]|nr:DMT family transporter [Oscillospiraceae bacterium]
MNVKQRRVNEISSLFILTAGVLWGIISLFVRHLQETGLTSMQIVSVRVLLAAVIMVLYLVLRDRQALRIKLKDLPLFFGTGVCSIVFFNFCYFKTIELTGGAAVPALLLYTSPVFVMILSMILFDEQITLRKFISLIITLAGLVLVTGVFSGNESVSLKVIFTGLGSGFGYALYSIFGKYLLPKYKPVTITAYTFIVAALFSVPFSGLMKSITMLITVKTLVSGTALAAVCTVLPFLLYTKGLEKTDAGKASVLATAEPFVAAITGAVFFHEEFTPLKMAGMILIFAAIIILNTGSTEKIY